MSTQALGQTTQRLRKARRLSTAQLGSLTGIHPGRVWAIENGYARLRSAELLRLAESLRVPPIYFFEDENMPGDPDEDGAWVCLKRR